MSTIEAEPTTAETGESDEKTLERDDIFHILQVQRRRSVLKYLQEYDGEEPVAMSDIAEHIAAQENDTTVNGLRSQQRQRVYIALYQSHLPKMDKMGVIEYNQYRGKVERTELTERFEQYLFDEPSILPDEDDGQADGTESETVSETETFDARTDQSTDAKTATTDWSRRYLYATGGAVLGLGGAVSGLLPQMPIATLVTGTFGVLGAGHAFETRWTPRKNA